MAAKCTVCGATLIGHPDDDVTCADCERQNFAGDLLRYPPQSTRCWWLTARGALAPRPRPDVLRSMARADGWSWSEERGDEEGDHA